jgi:oxygen-independent coproporphyrinogen-3 oxidase
MYDGLARLTGRELPWGLFTGVHPIRYIRENREQIGDFRISPEKLALADEIIAAQSAVLESVRDFPHLYTGIPFCPSRCKYCSFVSESVEKSYKLIPEYVDLLVRELQELAPKLPFVTAYLGGGTPTSLPADKLEGVLQVMSGMTANRREFTVEAGRPETLTEPILRVIAESGASRISVNPQSMNDRTLRAIGRGHTSADVYAAFERAAKFGFAINADLISGLPDESCSDFADSLNKVIALNPDNITVHSLAKKRSASIDAADCRPEADFTRLAGDILKSAGYSPYYLYRQSNSEGDNIGYTKSSDKICVYNVCNMDESSTVLAAGCGGATRIISGDGTVRKRYNPKYPYEYMSRRSS